MSQYVRLRDSDWRGYGNCCTCDKKIHFKEAHAGHYRHRYLDFEEKNVHFQCSACNTYRGGELDKYTLFLTRKYGAEVLEDLDKKFHAHKQKHDRTGKKYTMEELEDIIADLTEKIAGVPHG